MAFSFFQFWRKPETKGKIPFTEIPLFSALGPAELELIESKIRRVEYKKGDIVYRIGEKAEAFYIILLGRFRIIGPRGDTLIVLSQGDYFGESSILLGRNHSATIEAKNDGIILKIEKKDFQDLLSQIPSLSIHLSRTLGHRLTRSAMRDEISKTKIISICDYGIEFEKKSFAWNLAAMLTLMGKKKVILLGLESKGEDRFSKKTLKMLSLTDFHAASSDDIQKLIQAEKGGFHFLRVGNALTGAEADTGIAALIGFLIDRFDFILLDLPSEFSDSGVKALQQSDLIYFLVGENNRSSSKALSFLKEFQTSFGFTTDEIRFILCEQKESETSEPPDSKGNSTFTVFSFLPHEKGLEDQRDFGLGEVPFVMRFPDSSYSKGVRFLARELAGKLVGLVLGSGAAFGFSHVGVLRVLEREHIPVDIIAGSSIGALIGALWASGLDSHALEKIALSLDKKSTFFKLIGFQDVSLAHYGFFKGDQVCRFLKAYLDQKTFRALQVPLKIVASNLFTGEEVIFDEGNVIDAVRASISIPGIFRPVSWHRQYLIDGGVIDPLPVKVLSRYGVKKIIAVNVLSAPEDHIQRQELYEAKENQLEESERKKGFIARAWFNLGARLKKHFRANIFNVLMNTIQFLEYGMAETSAAGADIVIHPVLSDFHWAEFYSGSKLIRRGEEKTLEQLAEIKKLVEENA
ncbi:MAG: patatin-like phospholipase family protein [Candidatus Omnitrophica bacterium]|nr:patatin-like phospholipase family protein [Candidatus Omnitrophota bacterium]